MNILLFGGNGQVGWELQRALAPLGQVRSLDFRDCDLTDGEAVRVCVRKMQPDLIVNAAAYTAVDRAEGERDRAWAINAIAPGILAEEAARLDVWLVHYSTDYIFDGAKSGAYVEDDAAAPLSVYGASKLAGEQAILASGCRHLIFRTSWVYAARGGNFARTMLRLARERESLRVVADQMGAPTAAELIADVTALCLRDAVRAGGDKLQGLYHLAASGETSWHGFARFVLEQAQVAGVALACPPGRVEAITTEDYPTPARRPANSRLDSAKLQNAFGLALPDWTYHASRVLAEIIAQEQA